MPRMFKLSILAAGLLLSSICNAQVQPRLLDGPLSGFQYDVFWSSVAYPAAISFDGGVIVGFQANQTADYEAVTGAKWHGLSGAGELVRFNQTSPPDAILYDVSNDGSMMLGFASGAGYCIWTNGQPTALNIDFKNVDGAKMSGDGQWLLGVPLDGGIGELVHRTTGQVAHTFTLPAALCGVNATFGWTAIPNEVSTTGDAALLTLSAGTPQGSVPAGLYWRSGFGQVASCDVAPPGLQTRFTTMSGDGRKVYGYSWSGSQSQGFVFSFEDGMQLIANVPYAASEHGEVTIGNIVRTPRYGYETLPAFYQREGVLLGGEGCLGHHPQGISGDGRTIFGQCDFQGWALRLSGDYLCDSIDFNNDGSLFDPQDIEAFLSRYSEGPCVPEIATCNDIDFNNDTSIFDPEDINAFLRVYSEGPCVN